MKIVVAGGTGFIGAALIKSLQSRGHAVVLLTRASAKALQRSETVVWQPDAAPRPRPALVAAINGAEAIVNLAGEPIAGKRWTRAQKARLRSSRIDTTRTIVQAVADAQHKPRLLLNASAVGYYGARGDEEVTEAEPPGADFLSRLCREWEAEALRAEAHGVAVVRLRTGIVLGKGGGALAKMIPPFKFFIGGPLGSGRQWMPWIHLEDEVGLIEHLLTAGAGGAVNATAPEPVRMKEFCAALGKALGRPSWAPVPGFVLRLAFGEMADVLLTGQRAVPAEAQRRGYRFRFPTLPEALKDIVS
ncbi:MAG TPA: TIGR01777 family oxidoreductase [Candidatus Binatia bacterium]|jgi:hypothetical protein